MIWLTVEIAESKLSLYAHVYVCIDICVYIYLCCIVLVGSDFCDAFLNKGVECLRPRNGLFVKIGVRSNVIEAVR